MAKKYSVISFFAGVGGIDLGFEDAEEFGVVYANEFDANAQKTYRANFPHVPFDPRDIHEVNPFEGSLGKTTPTVLTAGFPCQAFSIAGYRKGFSDERGDLFFETMRMIDAKKPEVVLLENVKNLVTHDQGNTFTVIREYLVHAGYHIKWAVLNASAYGDLPQNRERIYVVAFRSRETFYKFNFPAPLEREQTIHEVIDFDEPQDDKFYYSPGVQRFYAELDEAMSNPNSIYQWRRQYVRENKSGVVPTLTANMGTGGHNVPIIRTADNRIRKLTPRETFRVQGFPKNFKLPSEVATSQLYKQAGNSVAVPVIKRIAKNISDALKQNTRTEVNPSDTAFDDIKAGTPGIMFTQLNDRMSGSAYPVKFFASISERDTWVDENEHKLPVFDHASVRAAARKGSPVSFHSRLG